ncbi:hypothetical protein M8J76_001641 [Diaphorina citri]|nr:hypothetical protein M8J75_005032 [Diaphorina citri]KAI5718879.1 hypothetical protein M8J76_001641 [Diaphorina citri]KAI5720119.1 hypothetical protein M8J77_002128 [Diaphorina citri]
MVFHPTWAQLRKIRHTTYGKGISGWWKQGWNEYPENMFAALHSVFGLSLGAYYIYNHHYYGTDIKEFKAEYTVWRSDDHRLAAYKEWYTPNYDKTAKQQQ